MFSSIIIFVVILSILVLVHELGHFLAAKRAGVWVEEFGFGIPPRIVGKKVGETIYSINLFPFGGFVRLHGELGDRKVKKPKRAFVNLDNKSKIKIVTAGVVMNFLLAVVAFSVVYSATGIPKDTQNVSVVEVAQGSPAENAGINDGDIIREVEGESVTSTQGFIDVVDSLKGDEILIALEREGESELVRVGITPRESPPEGEGPLGVAITTVETYFPPIWQRPFVGVYYGFQEALYWGWAVIAGIVSMLGNLLSGQVPKDIAGPVGIYAITSRAAKFGFIALVNFLGVFSVNLAILNIIPFPALDGGRLLFIGVESLFGKKVVPKVEAAIHAVGMVILISLILAITFYDVRRVISHGGISGFVDSVLR